ncbi:MULTISPECIES: hypothetical protein [unclassified Shinella]|uniref:hypothetical protein n=1 Tax=unclassified Shinella TaxID=2643062 RepID=UPI00234E57EE|nr:MULTISPECIES: hypothetical protein [unclassified Shinella]MCO5136393.1 hypothetical protein [Shinella sp.]MDC7253932.1 hypothetical protein [Shinella sp. YE25]
MKAAHLDIAPCSGLRRREDADGHIRIAHLVEDVLDFALHVFVREISEMPERHRKAGGLMKMPSTDAMGSRLRTPATLPICTSRQMSPLAV